MAVIVQRHEVRLIAPLKCGHTSLVNAFMTPAGEEVKRGGGSLECLKGFDTDGWPDATTTLVFLRSPVDRAKSVYHHLIVREPRAQLLELGFMAGMSFSEFCEHLKTVNLEGDLHIKPQMLSVAEHAQLGSVTLAMALDNANEEWPHLIDALGLDCAKELPRFNEAEYNIVATDYDLGTLLLLYGEDFAIWDNIIER